ncbi:MULTISPECIES: FecR domain-containing protein [Methylophaga]|jgi:transmembrane sensor|uniref:Fec operon regulator FecR n=2 Tax=Methylophaga TaxID=40222 RepID=A0ABP3CXL7_9GAMM|nr:MULTISPECIES: FecR domain-containing protein [Methylophaga]BDZ72425.1 protein FecR [Methylophaga marina]|tara:strand:- start:2767 stop:3738 length:972 start_codon:yes stop_codon:yes gene_type:complete
MAHSKKDALYEATNWFVELTSGEATDTDRKEWQRWLNASPENRQAWEQVETVTNCFMGLDSKTSIAVLNRPIDTRYIQSQERRQVIKTLSLLIAAGTAGWYGYQQKPWQVLLADYSTAVGEIKQLVLDDGTQLVLNTDTKLSVHYDEQVRNVRLLHGEVYVETAEDPNPTYRPFILTTEHGTIKALGTKFSTRLIHERSCVNVYEHAVEVSPINGYGDKVVVNRGEAVKFTADLFQQKMLFDASILGWTKGFLVVDNMPLKTFVEELSRYRTGMMRCDPAIADLEISGAFPVKDIDGALRSITKTLPVRVESYTRYVTMLKPA